MSCREPKQVPGDLAPPERPHYFDGKFLGARDLQMEQDYFNHKRWLLNRLGLGVGILCGLEVSPSRDGKQLCISPGLALDARGREVIVAEALCFDPRLITDTCGNVTETLAPNESHEITICLAYHESFADCTPVLVTDCCAQEQCAPGTIRESSRVVISKRQMENAEVEPDLCMALNGPAADSAERREHVNRVASGACASPSEERCVILAGVTLSNEGTVGEIHSTQKLTMLHSNERLFDMILCLAEHGGPQGLRGPQEPPRAGLSPELPRVVKISWQHGQTLRMNEFMEGLRVSFSEKITASPKDCRTWFIVSAEYPDVSTGTIAVQRVLDKETILGTSGDEVSFIPHRNVGALLDKTISAFPSDVVCRVVLKRDLLVAKDRISGDAVQGGEYESWFTLVR